MVSIPLKYRRQWQDSVCKFPYGLPKYKDPMQPNKKCKDEVIQCAVLLTEVTCLQKKKKKMIVFGVLGGVEEGGDTNLSREKLCVIFSGWFWWWCCFVWVFVFVFVFFYQE